MQGAKYVFATRSINAVEHVPPEKPTTSVPAALSALRRGPSGAGFIQGSRDFLNRVWTKDAKHDLCKTQE